MTADDIDLKRLSIHELIRLYNKLEMELRDKRQREIREVLAAKIVVITIEDHLM